MSFKGGILLKALLWLLLLVCCWPLALVLDLLVWLLTLPFRLVGIAFERVFEPLRAILLLPARVLGGARSWNWAISRDRRRRPERRRRLAWHARALSIRRYSLISGPRAAAWRPATVVAARGRDMTRRSVQVLIGLICVIPAALTASAPLWAQTPHPGGGPAIVRPEVKSVRVEARSKSIVKADGLQFRDLNANGTVDPYEDWRLPAPKRAADLLGRMTLEEKAGLMQITSFRAESLDDYSQHTPHPVLDPARQPHRSRTGRARQLRAGGGGEVPTRHPGGVHLEPAESHP